MKFMQPNDGQHGQPVDPSSLSAHKNFNERRPTIDPSVSSSTSPVVCPRCKSSSVLQDGQCASCWTQAFIPPTSQLSRPEMAQQIGNFFQQLKDPS